MALELSPNRPDEDLAAVERLFAELLAAWNRRDAQAFAALFTTSAEYVRGNGVTAVGREAIADLVRQAHAGSSVAITGHIQIHIVASSGNARFRWSSSSQGAGRRGVISCRITRGEQGWLIDRLRNKENQLQGGADERSWPIDS